MNKFKQTQKENHNLIYRNFYENAPVAFFSVGIDKKIYRCNKTAELLLGYTKEELNGMEVLNLYADSPNGKTKAKILFQKYLNGESVYDEELLMKKKSGELIWVSLTFNVLRDSFGNIIESRSTVLDITKRKLAEAKYIQESNKAELYLNLASVFMLALDKNGNILLLNKKGYEILGYQDDELIGQNWFENCIPLRIRDDVKNVFLKIVGGDLEPVEYFENPVLTKDGKERIIEWHNTILYDEDESIIGTLSSGLDVTEERELKTIKNNLLTRFSHEFKTPLISIKGFIELLISQYGNELNDDILKYLQRIQAGATRLGNLINSFIKTYLLEQKSLGLNLRYENLHIIVKMVLAELEGLIKKRNHKIDNQVDQNCVVFIDYEKIKTLLSNVIINAIKYTPPGGLITLKSKDTHNSVFISIRDTGIGLTEAEIESLFKPFGKLETYGKGWEVMIDGMGMGLFISKEIIKLHGGKIWIESGGKGKGSTVYLQFIKKFKDF